MNSFKVGNNLPSATTPKLLQFLFANSNGKKHNAFNAHQ